MMAVMQGVSARIKGSAMCRWLVVAAVGLLGFASHAEAQFFDTPTLRGTSPFIPAAPNYTRWTGAYVGGQAGFLSSQIDASSGFGTSNIFSPGNPLTAPLGPVTWVAPGRRDVRGSSYGGFIGYNTQFQDAVLGIELNYNRSSLVNSASASRCYHETDPLCLAAITLGDGNDYNATVVATMSTRVTDYGTIRGRAGWAIGDFMPYAMMGVAVGRVELTRSATVDATPVGAGAPFVHTETDTRSRFAWGYSAGGGVEYLLTSSVFLRGEYEFIKLNAVDGVGVTISTARFAAGLRF
jgi:opacity protein-like surface antigen